MGVSYIKKHKRFAPSGRLQQRAPPCPPPAQSDTSARRARRRRSSFNAVGAHAMGNIVDHKSTGERNCFERTNELAKVGRPKGAEGFSTCTGAVLFPDLSPTPGWGANPLTEYASGCETRIRLVLVIVLVGSREREREREESTIAETAKSSQTGTFHPDS